LQLGLGAARTTAAGSFVKQKFDPREIERRRRIVASHGEHTSRSMRISLANSRMRAGDARSERDVSHRLWARRVRKGVPLLEPLSQTTTFGMRDRGRAPPPDGAAYRRSPSRAIRRPLPLIAASGDVPTCLIHLTRECTAEQAGKDTHPKGRDKRSAGSVHE
jgi:hypothetical protein